jgi:AraC-like DNA-binding protein
MPQPAPQTLPQTIVTATGRRLAEFAALQDIDLAPLAQSLEIDTATFARTDLRISLESFMRLLRLLEVVSGDDCTGLRFAEHFQLGDTGPFGFALINAPNLRDALRVYRSYQRISADCGHFEIAEGNGSVEMRWRYAQPAEDPSQYADFHAALIVKVVRRYLGADWVPQRTALQRPPPRDASLHRRHFGPAIAFSALSGNAISLPAAQLEARSAAADPRLFEMMETSCRSALAALDRSKDLRLRIIEQVTGLLPSGEARLERVAEAVGMSERSLQRRLGELGTTFETLVDATRRDLSDRLLAGDTPLAEISYRCGYSNASAYSRATRAWYGMAPQSKRRQLRGTRS